MTLAGSDGETHKARQNPADVMVEQPEMTVIAATCFYCVYSVLHLYIYLQSILIIMEASEPWSLSCGKINSFRVPRFSETPHMEEGTGRERERDPRLHPRR